MRGIRTGIGALALIAATASTAAAQIELKNDDFVDNQAVTFHGGFLAGEIGASRFIPVGDPPYYVTAIRFLFGGAATQQTITLRIYDDSGLQTNPGTEVFSGDYDVTGSDNALHEIDLTLDNVQVTGPFRVGIEVQHSGAPSIANDTGGVDFPDRNYLFFTIWYAANSPPINIAGDWIIRADILNSGGTPDAGPVVTPDAGVPLPDAAAANPDASSGGQACMVHSECPTGQYCTEDDECTYDCRIDSDCGDDMRCTSLGMCEEDDSGGGCSAGGGGGGPLTALALALALIAVRRRG